MLKGLSISNSGVNCGTYYLISDNNNTKPLTKGGVFNRKKDAKPNEAHSLTGYKCWYGRIDGVNVDRGAGSFRVAPPGGCPRGNIADRDYYRSAIAH
jgi:hypothetical protein